MKRDESFAETNFDEALNPEKFVGRAPQQVDDFLRDTVEPIRKRYADKLAHDSPLKV